MRKINFDILSESLKDIISVTYNLIGKEEVRMTKTKVTHLQYQQFFQ